jgi:hypothetical protein
MSGCSRSLINWPVQILVSGPLIIIAGCLAVPKTFWLVSVISGGLRISPPEFPTYTALSLLRHSTFEDLLSLYDETRLFLAKSLNYFCCNSSIRANTHSTIRKNTHRFACFNAICFLALDDRLCILAGLPSKAFF